VIKQMLTFFVVLQMTLPRSVDAVLQLPLPTFEQFLNEQPAFIKPLVQHAREKRINERLLVTKEFCCVAKRLNIAVSSLFFFGGGGGGGGGGVCLHV
jgi:hypothetical protein